MLFKSIILLLFIIGVVLTAQITMSYPKQFCIEPDPDATRTFGQNIAINDRYLAISDSLRSKVIVYALDDSGEWQKAKKILPPADLDLSNVSSAFGTGLELDGDVLAISARTINPEWLEAFPSQRGIGIIPRDIYWRYLTNLETETPLEPIDLLVEPEPKSDRVRLNLLRQGKIEQFILPKMGKRDLGSNSIYRRVALDENLFLAGYLSEDLTGGAYLFDLARPEAEPIELFVEDTALGGTIAVSQQFAAVGFDGFFFQFSQGNARDRSHMTLIRNVENGATNIIKTFGKVSLSGNILAVMHPYHYEAPTVFLEVYRLDENANAHLIDKRKVYQGEVQNGFLFTQKYDDSHKVCIEPLPKN